MNKSNLVLLSIFLISVIPVIYVYINHAGEELNSHYNAKTETKAIKTLGESSLFYAIGFGYIVMTAWIVIGKLVNKESKIPYIIILVGTILVIVVYFLRIYGIPIPGTDIVITDLSTDYRDVITKIGQSILIIPIAMLLQRMIEYKN